MSEPSRAPVPREVRIASVLLIALGAILTVNAVVGVLYRDDLRSSAQEDVGALLSADQVDTVLLVAVALIFAVGVLSILAGIYVRSGRQWARVLAFVSGGILILFAGIGAMAGGGFLAAVLLGAAVGAVALLMQAAVAPFFEPRPQRTADTPGS